ncbi:predicted protein [Plenodomus lingam JN3]|uniref:Predicted protein n=1 Tax=Leptosphaeria maculans (strain JN3 / isolate v23.1.3 / race Av1-4-5-6-7-8) TaxID=985895 RepID=E4ZLD9_LEPMJ|nr:predicted protein [Plenodomus lingam JN3]CBX92298.1 predicted protein [Plenodomus lingam JN3]
MSRLETRSPVDEAFAAVWLAARFVDSERLFLQAVSFRLSGGKRTIVC